MPVSLLLSCLLYPIMPISISHIRKFGGQRPWNIFILCIYICRILLQGYWPPTTKVTVCTKNTRRSRDAAWKYTLNNI